MSNGNWTDTLGNTALTVVGSAPSNTTLSFANYSGNSTFTVTYKPYNIKTYFNCSGINEYSASNVYLVDTVELPDGTQYGFSYEQTPQHSGYYTGRPLSVSLPTGGTITYAYTGGSNGIECADGTTAGLNRTTPDGTWTYIRSGSGSAWTTTLLAPTYPSTGGVQDQTVIDFLTGSMNSIVYFYPIRSRRYSGTSTLMETDLTCYEASDTNCSATIGDSGASVSLPIGRVKQTRQMWGSGGPVISSGTIDQIDSYGNISSHAVYDYASGTSFGALLQTTSVSYNNYYNEYELPNTTTITDGSTPANTIASTSYQYTSTVTATSGTPSHVNQTAWNISAIKQLVIGSTYLTSSYTYYDTGNVQTMTDVNGTNVTTFAYGACGNSFVTGTTTPVKSPSGTVTATLTSSAGWNCSGGVPTSATDLNTNPTTYTYGSDPYWRPVSVTDGGQNVTSYSYPAQSNPNTWSSSLTFNSSNSVNSSVTTTDGLGRTLLQQTKQAPSSSQYDSVAFSYDSRGRLNCKTEVPYSGTEGSYTAPSSSTGTCTIYDALDRQASIGEAGGGSIAYTYGINTSTPTSTMYSALGPAPAGESTKRRLSGYNGAGQLTSVCEVTSLSGAGSCGTGSGYSGYLTQYTYDGPNLIKTQQDVQPNNLGVQTRTINGYDGLGRPSSDTIPEWSAGNGVAGTKNYTYDSDPTCGSSSGDLVKTVDNVGNVICNSYDSLHRLLKSTVNSGPYASSTPAANYVYDAATCNGTVMQNAAGNLAEAFTGSSGSKTTDVCFSGAYSTSGVTTGGVISKSWESTPHSGGYLLTTDTYYPNGALGARTGSYGSPSLTYGVDGEGRANAATDTTHSINLVTTASYNTAGMVTGVTYGNGDSDTFNYDASTNRPTKIVNSIGGGSPFNVTTTLTWNSNWSLGQMQIADTNDSTKNQTCTYKADDLRRLASGNCGTSTWAQNFTYDAFGNINKANAGGATSYSAAYSAVTNQVSSGISPLPGYDKNGNQLNSTGLSSISWNASAVPVSVTPVSGSAITGTFDALNRLVETTSGSTYTQFVYGPSTDKIAVIRNGSLIKGLVPLPGGEAAAYTSAGLNFIRHTDWLDSSRLATTWAHAVYSKESYAPFGEVYNEAGSADRSFTGQDQDTVTGAPATGVYDFMFRKFDPAAGRWLSPDPAGWSAVYLDQPQSLNRYAYVENNPLSWVDPLGLCTEVVTSWAPYDSENPGKGSYPNGWTYMSGGPYGPPCDGSQGPTQPTAGNPGNGGNGSGGGPHSGPYRCSMMDSAGCLLNQITIPTCKHMDNTGDVIGGAGALGTIGFGAASLTTAGASSPVTVPGMTISGIAWASGNLLNILAKHGILCKGSL
jgi:RHS repeat-associated protein